MWATPHALRIATPAARHRCRRIPSESNGKHHVVGQWTRHSPGGKYTGRTVRQGPENPVLITKPGPFTVHAETGPRCRTVAACGHGVNQGTSTPRRWRDRGATRSETITRHCAPAAVGSRAPREAARSIPAKSVTHAQHVVAAARAEVAAGPGEEAAASQQRDLDRGTAHGRRRAGDERGQRRIARPPQQDREGPQDERLRGGREARREERRERVQRHEAGRDGARCRSSSSPLLGRRPGVRGVRQGLRARLATAPRRTRVDATDDHSREREEEQRAHLEEHLSKRSTVWRCSTPFIEDLEAPHARAPSGSCRRRDLVPRRRARGCRAIAPSALRSCFLPVGLHSQTKSPTQRWSPALAATSCFAAAARANGVRRVRCAYDQEDRAHRCAEINRTTLCAVAAPGSLSNYYLFAQGSDFVAAACKALLQGFPMQTRGPLKAA